MFVWLRVFLALMILAAAPAARADDLAARMDAYMRARTELGHFTGAVAVMRNSELLFQGAYGPADLNGRANTPETLFQAASITKPMTALAILRLRDAGRLTLDDRLCRFIQPCPESWSQITLDQLLRHTAGVPDYETALTLGSPDWTAMMRRPDSAAAIVDWARARPLDFAPGQRFAYSNTGYVLLARVIAEASGESYEQYVRETVLAPFSLTAARLGGDGPADKLASGLTGTDEPSSEVLAAGRAPGPEWMRAVPETIPGADHGDAALLTTAADLARFGDRYLATLSPEDAELVRRDPTGEGYGLGWMLTPNGGLAHNGVLPGFVSRLSLDPANGLTIAVLSNFDGGRFDAVARDLAQIARGRPYEAPRSHRIAPMDPAWAEGLTGAWKMGALDVTIEMQNGRLFLAAPGRFRAGLLPEGRDVFYLPFFEGVIRVERDAAEAVTGWTLTFRGESHPARRP